MLKTVLRHTMTTTQAPNPAPQALNAGSVLSARPAETKGFSPGRQRLALGIWTLGVAKVLVIPSSILHVYDVFVAKCCRAEARCRGLYRCIKL